MKTSVRFLAVLFALLMALFVVSAVAFDDVEPTHKHYEAIELLTSLGIIDGYEDGTFKPDQPVERDEMAKMIFIMATAFYDAGNGTQVFPDVPDGHWAQGFISWCHTKDIVGGYEDGTFRPDDNITYDEALKMVATMLGYTDFDPELWPTDVRTVALKQLNLGENLPDTLQGDTVITRAQAAQILYNAFYKSMATTKTVSYYEPEGYEDATGNPVSREVKIEVAMTLAADVWDFSITEYKIVATENYAVNDVENGLFGTEKTGKADTIKIWDGETVLTASLEDLGLSSYKGNTDSLIGFTLSKVTKDGKDFKMSGIKGARYDNVSVNWVTATASTEGAWKSGSTYWYSDRIKLNGVLYSDDNFWNLRTVYVAKDATDTVFNVMSMPTAFADQFNSPSQTWETPVGTFGAISTSAAPYILSEVHINDYRANGYSTKLVWAVDSEGDGVIDYVFLKYVMPYIVTGVTDVVNNGQKDQLITYADLYSSTNTHTVYKSDVIFTSELKTGDIFTAAKIADSLYVEMVVQPQVTNLTSVTNGGKPTFAGIDGLSSIGENFLDLAAATVKDSIFDASEADYWLTDNADGTARELKVWIYKNKLIYTTAYDASSAAQDDSYNKAILLYVDKKTDKQLDYSTNKFVEFYPAYILINGKEEAINLNPDNAIDGASAAYVSADGSPYRASINSDSTLGFVYKLVTYTVDANGYYTLYTENDDRYDADKNLVEKVIPASDNPKLQYNELTGYYKLVTDNETYGSIDIDDSTILYYNYTKAATGDYKYIAFYTSDNIVSGKINEIAFNSDVYLTYDAEDDFYTLNTALLAGKLEAVTGGTTGSAVDPNKDGRVVYLAIEDSAAVALNGKAYYEHKFINIGTGEIFTVVQDKITIGNNAVRTYAGNFYTWSEDNGDYYRVTVHDLNSTDYDVVASVNVARGLIFDMGNYTEGIKISEDVKIVAFDDDLNRYELTLSDLADAVKFRQDNNSDGAFVIYVTYIDENSNTQIAYIITDYLAKNESGSVLHENVTDNFYW